MLLLVHTCTVQISEFHSSIIINHYVIRLDISVYESFSMEGLDSIKNLRGDVADLLFVELTNLGPNRSQRAMLAVFHDHLEAEWHSLGEHT